MLVIGLTGGIASGKSTVSAILRDLGATVIDGDAIARAVTRPGEPAYQEIVATFGPGILKSDGSLDRRALGRKVFTDPDLRRTLNRITHPRIIARIAELVDQARERGDRVVVIEAPLLIEAGMQDMVDEVWVVLVDEETQVERLMARERYPEAEAQGRVEAQLPLAEKLKFAHRVIDNRGSVEETRRAVEKLWRDSLARRQSPVEG